MKTYIFHLVWSDIHIFYSRYAKREYPLFTIAVTTSITILWKIRNLSISLSAMSIGTISAAFASQITTRWKCAVLIALIKQIDQYTAMGFRDRYGTCCICIGNVSNPIFVIWALGKWDSLVVCIDISVNATRLLLETFCWLIEIYDFYLENILRNELIIDVIHPAGDHI